MSKLTVLRIVSIMLVVSATAMAGLTPVKTPPGSELSHESIFEGVYGGNFVSSTSNSGMLQYGNGTVMATRVRDTGDPVGVVDVVTGPGLAADQFWGDGLITATATARYAAYNQRFGYMDGLTGGSFTTLFDVTGYGLNVMGSGSVDLGGEQWRWIRDGQNGPHSSLPSENADGRDHMVTYKIDGLGTEGTTWMLFWEDLNLGDADYNDLVVEINAIGAGTVPVPAPGAALLGAMGLGLIRLNRRRL